MYRKTLSSIQFYLINVSIFTVALLFFETKAILNSKLVTTNKYYPYHVVVVTQDHVCNGALIKNGEFVVTSAECVTDDLGNIFSNEILVTAKLNRLTELKNLIYEHVQTIYVPGDYKKLLKIYRKAANIAVLKVIIT